MQGLSQNLQQSLELRQYQIQRLEILSMSSDELADFLNEARLENPLLEMEPDQSELEKDLSVARWLNVSSVPVPRGYQNPEEPLELDIPDQRGETLEQATAPFVSDEYFETWYAAALETLNGRLAG